MTLWIILASIAAALGLIIGILGSTPVNIQPGRTMPEHNMPWAFNLIPIVIYLALGQICAEFIFSIEYIEELELGLWYQFFVGLGLMAIIVATLFYNDIIQDVPIEHRQIQYFAGRYFFTVGEGGGMIGRVFSPLVPFLFTLEDQTDVRSKTRRQEIGEKNDGVPFVGSSEGLFYFLLISGRINWVLSNVHGDSNFEEDLRHQIDVLGANLVVSLSFPQTQRLIYYLSMVDVIVEDVGGRVIGIQVALNDRDFEGTPEEEEAIERHIIPQIRNFIEFCRDRFGYLVTDMGAKDVTPCSDYVRDVYDKQITAPMKTQAALDEAAGIRAKSEAEAAGPVAIKNAEGQAAAAANAAIPDSVTVWAPGGNVGPMVGGGGRN